MEKFLKYKMMYDLSGSNELFKYVKENMDDEEFIKTAIDFMEVKHNIYSFSGSTSALMENKLLIIITCGEELDLYTSAKFNLKIDVKLYGNSNSSQVNILSTHVTFSKDNNYCMRLIREFLLQDKLPTLFIKKILEDKTIKQNIKQYDIQHITLFGNDYVMNKSTDRIDLLMSTINKDKLEYIHFPVMDK